MYVHNSITILTEDNVVYNILVNSVVVLPKVNTFLKGYRMGDEYSGRVKPWEVWSLSALRGEGELGALIESH